MVGVYSLALTASGDLAVTSRRAGTVRGHAKLEQELATWLAEAYQVDRFHPGYGSTLQEHLGLPNTQLAVFSVQTEVARVCDNYRRMQALDAEARPDYYDPDEILDRVVSIQAAQYVDQLRVHVVYTTLAGAYETTITVE